MRTIDSCHSHEIDKHPRFVWLPEPIELSLADSGAHRAFTALHALRRPFAPLQGVFFPAMVAFERSASDLSVTQPSSAGDFAPALQESWAKIACPALS